MSNSDVAPINILTVKGAWELGTWILANYKESKFQDMLDGKLAAMLDAEVAAGGKTIAIIKQWAASLPSLNLDQLPDPAAVKSEMAFAMAAATIFCPIVWAQNIPPMTPSSHDAHATPPQWRHWPEAIIAPALEQSVRQQGTKDDQIQKLVNALADGMASANDTSADPARVRSLAGRLYSS